MEREDTLEWMGRFLGRIHLVGASREYQARPTLDIQSFGVEPRSFLVAGNWLPDELRTVWISVADQALDAASRAYQRAGSVQMLRLHGDCHPGNVLWTDDALISLTSTTAVADPQSRICGCFYQAMRLAHGDISRRCCEATRYFANSTIENCI